MNPGNDRKKAVEPVDKIFQVICSCEAYVAEQMKL